MITSNTPQINRCIHVCLNKALHPSHLLDGVEARKGCKGRGDTEKRSTPNFSPCPYPGLVYTRLLAIGVVAGFIAWWWMGGCYKAWLSAASFRV